MESNTSLCHKQKRLTPLTRTEDIPSVSSPRTFYQLILSLSPPFLSVLQLQDHQPQPSQHNAYPNSERPSCANGIHDWQYSSSPTSTHQAPSQIQSRCRRSTFLWIHINHECVDNTDDGSRRPTENERADNWNGDMNTMLQRPSKHYNRSNLESRPKPNGSESSALEWEVLLLTSKFLLKTSIVEIQKLASRKRSNDRSHSISKERQSNL
jgi:hypothetical protein